MATEQVNALTTDQLASIFVENLRDAISEGSALLAAGTTNVNYSTNILRRMVMPGAAYTDEQGVKRVANPVLSDEEVHYLKFVQPIIASDEYLDTAEGRAAAAKTISLALATFPKSVDISIINGTDPRTGDKISKLSNVNLKDNATQFTSTPENVDVVIDTAALSMPEAEQVLFSRKGFSQVGQLRTTQNGLRKYPDVKRKGLFDFSGLDAHTFESVGLDGWTPAPVFNDNLAVVGDFSKIGMAWLEPTVKLLKEATIGGVNLAETNQVCYMVEFKLKFYIDDVTSFAVVKSTPVDPEG